MFFAKIIVSYVMLEDSFEEKKNDKTCVFYCLKNFWREIWEEKWYKDYAPNPTIFSTQIDPKKILTQIHPFWRLCCALSKPHEVLLSLEFAFWRCLDKKTTIENSNFWDNTMNIKISKLQNIKNMHQAVCIKLSAWSLESEFLKLTS